MSFTPRLYILNTAILKHSEITPSDEQCHHLLKVLRLKDGGIVNVFNERDGEFESELKLTSKGRCTLTAQKLLRAPDINGTLPQINLAFAPTKGLGAGFIVQKACELGVDNIYPVFTDRSIVKSVNLEKLHKIATDAAQQCERLSIPKVFEMQPYGEFLGQMNFGDDTQVVICYEDASENSLAELDSTYNTTIIIGPEGGFTKEEYTYMISKKAEFPHIFVSKIHNNILRAETAAIAALSIVNYLIRI